jgi:hypothetical protein
MNANPTGAAGVLPADSAADQRLPPGESPGDREPITGPLPAIEAILRQPRRVMYQLRQPGAGPLIIVMGGVAIFCALLYGLVVGTFSMGAQLWAAPVKIAFGMVVAALICLPSLYIFSCLSGCRTRLLEIFGLVAGLMLLMTLLLVGFAPVAWLFSESTASVVWMGALHIAFWFVASVFGLRFLHAAFQHSGAKSSAGLYVWTILFVLVSLQMTTALRPLVGKADTLLPAQKRFFLTHWAESVQSSQRLPGASGTHAD